MKSRMACSACKARGKTSYGRWHSDPECPYYGQKTEKPKVGEKPVFAVTEEDITDSEESFDVYVADLPGFSTVTVEDMDHRLALADTCCARTVAGSSKEASNW